MQIVSLFDVNISFAVESVGEGKYRLENVVYIAGYTPGDDHIDGHKLEPPRTFICLPSAKPRPCPYTLSLDKKQEEKFAVSSEELVPAEGHHEGVPQFADGQELFPEVGILVRITGTDDIHYHNGEPQFVDGQEFFTEPGILVKTTSPDDIRGQQRTRDGTVVDDTMYG